MQFLDSSRYRSIPSILFGFYRSELFCYPLFHITTTRKKQFS